MMPETLLITGLLLALIVGAWVFMMVYSIRRAFTTTG